MIEESEIEEQCTKGFCKRLMKIKHKCIHCRRKFHTSAISWYFKQQVLWVSTHQMCQAPIFGYFLQKVIKN